ncbi:ASKHA domain-containing protein [Thermodesulfobacteriota bacterium]
MAVLRKYKILFNPIGKTVDVLSGTSILEAARLAGINLTAVCGGNGSCGQCRVIISEGEVSPPKSNEENFLTHDDINSGYRLACSTFPKSNIKIHIPGKSLLTEMKLQIDGERVDVQIDPLIQAFDIALDKPALENPVADLDSVLGVLKGAHNIEKLSADVMAVKQLSPLLRENNWEVSVFIRHDEIIGFWRKGALPVGFAVDMGTTKIAAYLMDLTTGKELASTGAINPQTVYGDDVMSRLDIAINGGDSTESGITKLSKIVRDLFNEMIDGLTAEADITKYQVADICIVGNTAMTHLFLELPVKQLASSPYVAASNTAIDVKARDLNLSACPGAYVHILPGIGGFVGADHVSMILASGIDLKKKITLGLDIGTNTEIVLSNPADNSLVSLSCPSGPAFEGAHVTDGMRAANGAIESVKLTEEGVEYKTIGNDPAIGLCGSGIIDVVAELYRWNIINDRGRFNRDNKRVTQGKYGSEFILVDSDNGGSNIVISQKDIAEIQLAKGAIKAGIEALMEVCNITEDMIEEVIIAGAFGSYIDLINAVDIGLLPSFPNARYIQVGNSAGVGAKMVLVSQRLRQRAQSISAKTRYLELTTHASFNRRFAQGMRFPLEKQVISNNE